MPKREHTRPWKHIYGIDRGYTQRKDVADTNAAARAKRSDQEQLHLIFSERRGISLKEATRLGEKIKIVHKARKAKRDAERAE